MLHTIDDAVIRDAARIEETTTQYLYMGEVVHRGGRGGGVSMHSIDDAVIRDAVRIEEATTQ